MRSVRSAFRFCTLLLLHATAKICLTLPSLRLLLLGRACVYIMLGTVVPFAENPFLPPSFELVERKLYFLQQESREKISLPKQTTQAFFALHSTSGKNGCNAVEKWRNEFSLSPHSTRTLAAHFTKTI